MLGIDGQVLEFIFQMMLAGAGIGFVMHVGAGAVHILKGTLFHHLVAALVGAVGAIAGYGALVFFADMSIVPCSYLSKSPIYLGSWLGLLASVYYLTLKISKPAGRVTLTIGFIACLALIFWIIDC